MYDTIIKFLTNSKPNSFQPYNNASTLHCDKRFYIYRLYIFKVTELKQLLHRYSLFVDGHCLDYKRGLSDFEGDEQVIAEDCIQ